MTNTRWLKLTIMGLIVLAAAQFLAIVKLDSELQLFERVQYAYNAITWQWDSQSTATIKQLEADRAGDYRHITALEARVFQASKTPPKVKNQSDECSATSFKQETDGTFWYCGKQVTPGGDPSLHWQRLPPGNVLVLDEGGSYSEPPASTVGPLIVPNQTSTGNPYLKNAIGVQ